MFELMQETAEEQRFALLVQAEHVVELGGCPIGDDLAQKSDICGRHFHVDQKISAVRRKQQRQLHRISQQRIDHQMTRVVMLDGGREWIRRTTIDKATHHVRRLVAKKQRRQYLN